MSDESEKLEVLTRVATETEASLIVQCLTDCGIAATAVGGFTSGFKAEAPGDVSVLVKQGDLANATEALITIRQEQSSKQATDAEEDGATHHEEPYDKPRWRRVVSIFWIVYLVICIPIGVIGFFITRNFSFLFTAFFFIVIFGMVLQLSWYAKRRSTKS
ncbi:MAG TPA: hypothetical protein VIH42_03760 [Thermoguttaceae bacterium]